MLTVRQAQDLIGVEAGQLLLLALTQQIPSHKDPDSRLILFDPHTLLDWAQNNGRTFFTHPPTR
jgi:hypothetical protein